jgi:hypothetical protein
LSGTSWQASEGLQAHQQAIHQDHCPEALAVPAWASASVAASALHPVQVSLVVLVAKRLSLPMRAMPAQLSNQRQHPATPQSCSPSVAAVLDNLQSSKILAVTRSQSCKFRIRFRTIQHSKSQVLCRRVCVRTPLLDTTTDISNQHETHTRNIPQKLAPSMTDWKHMICL